MKILSINPGSTSTKIGLYENETELFRESIEHSADELSQYKVIYDQYDFRLNLVLDTLKKHGYEPSDLAAVAGRGGMFPPVHAGAYLVDENLKNMILADEIPRHASNLGALLAAGVAEKANIPAYIYDAVSSDEFEPTSRILGIKGMTRQSFCHVLNIKAVAREYAKRHNVDFDKLNCVVAHLGGGISLGALKNGKIVDGCPDDFGPFAPERSGRIPAGNMIDFCLSGNYKSKHEATSFIRGNAGVKGLLGTTDMRVVLKNIENGDEYSKLVLDAMIKSVAKEIGGLSASLCGNVDAIIITGGIAKSDYITESIKNAVSFIAPVEIIAGEFEMEALALGIYRVMLGKEEYHKWEKTED